MASDDRPAGPWEGHDVPWPPGASLQEAQASFDVSVDKVRAMMQAIDARKAVTLVRKGDVAAGDIGTLREALDAYSIRQWGQPLSWRAVPVPEGSGGVEAMEGTVPDVVLPPLPAACATCGAALQEGDGRLRFLPGGWEHQCYGPQAGHFPASPEGQ